MVVNSLKKGDNGWGCFKEGGGGLKRGGASFSSGSISQGVGGGGTRYLSVVGQEPFGCGDLPDRQPRPGRPGASVADGRTYQRHGKHNGETNYLS